MATTYDRPTARRIPVQIPEAHTRRPVDYVWAIARIALGWTFLWAFLDKTFGLGFATTAEKAWLAGGSPTTGFLKGTEENALGGFFTALAGHAWVDWLFMLGLLGIGLALMLGIGTRVAAVAGGLMMVMMWAAALPLTTNPFMDEHLVYTVVLAGLAMANAGETLGLGKTAIVQRYPILK
ncbi:DoxX family membrane protein [Nonomuraea sp. NPDC049486]|uniref:DoxX family membrane protein n=1 Tax=Nonomuraea harbinensis TaxID=1286938 RepID=A0ABW1BM15_9ACTN|nr:DoxX family membrane protein [Nonomuraea harbinensis]